MVPRATTAGIRRHRDRRSADRRAWRPVYRIPLQPRFTGSRRYYRGRVVEALRALPAGAALPLGNLGPTLKPDYTDADLPWLIDLVTTLATDGLIQLDRTDQQPAAWRIGLG